jgi:hypothetical protein
MDHWAKEILFFAAFSLEKIGTGNANPNVETPASDRNCFLFMIFEF